MTLTSLWNMVDSENGARVLALRVIHGQEAGVSSQRATFRVLSKPIHCWAIAVGGNVCSLITDTVSERSLRGVKCRPAKGRM